MNAHFVTTIGSIPFVCQIIPFLASRSGHTAGPIATPTSDGSQHGVSTKRLLAILMVPLISFKSLYSYCTSSEKRTAALYRFYSVRVPSTGGF